MEINALSSKSGNKCAVHAALGMPGRFSWAVCVALMVAPFESMTMVGGLAGIGLWHGLVVDMKCPVQPVLAMPLLV
jgi:hypothetical protein